MPAGDQPSDIITGTTHGSGKQRSVSVKALYVMAHMVAHDDILYIVEKFYVLSTKTASSSSVTQTLNRIRK